MTGTHKVGLALLALAAALAALSTGSSAQEAHAPQAALKVAMVNTLFRDVPPAMVQLLTPTFQNLMREQTGLEGEVVVAGDALDLGRRLNNKSVQLGLFYGFEFAWAKQAYPDLRPLVVAVNGHRQLRAMLIVRNDSTAAALADLKGKSISVPRRSREYCLLFLDRELAKLGADQKGFFGTVVRHPNMEDALDDILRDKVQATLVDGGALANYEQVKPGCFARLKVLKQSEPFPPGVVAYRQGALDAATLTRFKSGMMVASQSVRGRELMALIKLTAFEDVPSDFERLSADVLKTYPAPVASSTKN